MVGGGLNTFRGSILSGSTVSGHNHSLLSAGLLLFFQVTLLSEIQCINVQRKGESPSPLSKYKPRHRSPWGGGHRSVSLEFKTSVMQNNYQCFHVRMLNKNALESI